MTLLEFVTELGMPGFPEDVIVRCVHLNHYSQTITMTMKNLTTDKFQTAEIALRRTCF